MLRNEHYQRQNTYERFERFLKSLTFAAFAALRNHIC